jgi:hypothetical protein
LHGQVQSHPALVDAAKAVGHLAERRC